MLLPINPWGQVVYVFVLSIIRYVLFAGIAFLLFYVAWRNKRAFAKIQQRWPENKDYRREVLYSFMTFFIFALVPLVLSIPVLKPYKTVYRDIHQHSMAWFVLAVPVMLLIHDTYFYFAHRMMHHPRLFRLLHTVHHKSTNPSPWAAFSFQPAEAVIESGVIYVFVFTIPVHIIHLFVFLIIMTIYNVYGHLGFELYPAGFNRHPVGKWFNTSVNHNMHHQYFRGNYGLYFTFWDRIFDTVNKGYDERFDKVTGAKSITND
jgi:sterol desaturase/sphingolipid hydroxylase (fatty acid hydroxylase superfamily)